MHDACHTVAQMGARVVSRDFPGAMVDSAEQELGDDCLAMFLPGAQGNLDPYDLHNLRGENRLNIARQAGISLGKGALRVAEELKGGAYQLAICPARQDTSPPPRRGCPTGRSPASFRVSSWRVAWSHWEGAETRGKVFSALLDSQVSWCAIPRSAWHRVVRRVSIAGVRFRFGHRELQETPPKQARSA